MAAAREKHLLKPITHSARGRLLIAFSLASLIGFASNKLR
jgi:hypothetical protein